MASSRVGEASTVLTDEYHLPDLGLRGSEPQIATSWGRGPFAENTPVTRRGGDLDGDQIPGGVQIFFGDVKRPDLDGFGELTSAT
jgi:hypothetical protein